MIRTAATISGQEKMALNLSQATIIEPAPQLSDRQAIDIARQHYGLDGSVVELVSERDLNFRVELADGRRFVLKIANAAEPRIVTDFQIQALLHIERRNPDLPVPRIRRTDDGASEIELACGEKMHIARMVSYLDGVPMEEVALTPALCRRLGGLSAALGIALADFRHPGSNQDLIWDLKRTLELRELLQYVPSNAVRQLLEDALSDFAAHAQPVLSDLRSQVIHQDLHAGNVIVDEKDHSSPIGIIDFGDMLTSPLIVDVAVCSAYLRNFEGDPTLLIAEYVAGYHAVTPLRRNEIDLLYDLTRARLAATVSILRWRGTLPKTDDDFLQQSSDAVPAAEAFLDLLSAMPCRAFTERIRQVCASVDERCRA